MLLVPARLQSRRLSLAVSTWFVGHYAARRRSALVALNYKFKVVY
jgi:hypothetical protein